MADTNSDSLALSILDTREDIASLEAGITELTDQLPQIGHTPDLWIPQDQTTGVAVQIRMDREYLALRQSDLRRLERRQAARLAA